MIHEFVADYKDGFLSRRDMIRRVLYITGGVASTAAILYSMGCGGQAGGPTPSLATKVAEKPVVATAAPASPVPAAPAAAASPAASPAPAAAPSPAAPPSPAAAASPGAGSPVSVS